MVFEWRDIIKWFGSLEEFNNYYGSDDETNVDLAVEMCKGFYAAKYGK